VHDTLDVLSLCLLVSVEYVWSFSRQPREYLVELRLVRSVPEYKNVLWVDAFAKQQVI
jgi:hypothetical protein